MSRRFTNLTKYGVESYWYFIKVGEYKLCPILKNKNNDATRYRSGNIIGVVYVRNSSLHYGDILNCGW